MTSPRDVLLSLFDAALKAADPAACLVPYLPEPGLRRTIVVGAGKAAAAMARGVEQAYGDVALEGMVITRYGHGVETRKIEVVEAAHPVPDEAGLEAAGRMMAMVEGLTSDDLVLCLISGGGSALLTLPADGLDFAEKQAINRELLRCGAAISEINCVRKHLSAVKGGRLAAAAHPARLVSLLISDVPGDDPAVIASGPTVPDATTCADALRILDGYGIGLSASTRALLESAGTETPKPGDSVFANNETRLVATPQMALEAAAEVARAAGYAPLILSDCIEGESREAAIVHADIARQVSARNQPVSAPAILLSGGETTVTIRGEGRGGPNAEFALSLAIALDGLAGVYAIACDTDGVDGAEEIAGAVIGPETLARARAEGLDPALALADNDAHTFFEYLNDAVVPGPTLTNVNDFRAILVEGK